MNYKTKLERIVNRYEITQRRLSSILEIPIGKINSILGGTYEPSRIEKKKINFTLKALKLLSKGVNYEDEINFQLSTIRLIKDRMYERLRYIDSGEFEKIKELILVLEYECMYLGVLYDDNDEEELVYTLVRKGRRELD